MKTYNCSCCGAPFSYDKPYRKAYCPPCVNAKAVARRAADPEKARAIAKKSRENNPDAVKARNLRLYHADPEAGRARARAYRRENPDKAKAANLNWRENNAERFKAMQHAWIEQNREHRSEYRKRHHAATKPRALQLARDWKAANPGKCAAYTAKRTAIKKNAIPGWSNAEATETVYQLARMLTDSTGEQYHVDHIVPLVSPYVCGLHWHGNLRILTAHENQSKSNRFDPNTPLAVGAY